MKKLFTHLIRGLAVIAFGPLASPDWLPQVTLAATSLIPILTPPPNWPGVDCSYGYGASCPPKPVVTALQGTSGYQLQPSAVWDEPPKMWIEPGCAGKCEGKNYVIGIVAGNADRAQIAKVVFYLEGATETVTAPSKNPRTDTFGYNINIQSSLHDGDAVLFADVYPVNGHVRRLMLPLTLNTNGSLTHQAYYLDNSGSDSLCSGKGKGAPVGEAPNQDCAWASFNHAQSTAISGSVIYVTSGQTFLDDVSTGAANFTQARMIQFLPSEIGAPYKISKSSRYENGGYFKLIAQNVLFDTAIFDMSMIGAFSNGSPHAVTVLRNVQLVDPYGAGGPNLTSANCVSGSAFPCLYGSPESPTGNLSHLFVEGTGTYAAIIDSPALSQTVEITKGNLYRNWNVLNSLDTFSEFGSPANGSFQSRAYLHVNATANQPFFNRDTYDFAQNIKVAAINYCANGVTLPGASGARTTANTNHYVDPHGATIVQLAITPTIFQGTISGTTLTVSGKPSSPLIPSLYFTGSGISGSVSVVGQLAPTKWKVSSPQDIASTTTFISTGTTPSGGEAFGGGIFHGNNFQYAIFGSKGSLTNGGVMFVGDYGNNGSDALTGPVSDPTCGNRILVAPNAPYVVLECNGGHFGVCDPDFRNARTLVLGPSGAPVLEGEGALPAVPAVGDTVLLFNIGHPDLGQITGLNSTTENYQNLVMQSSTLAGVESQPFLYGAGSLTTTTMTGSQRGTEFIADPVIVSAVSGAVVTLAATPALPNLSTSSRQGWIGGAVSQSGKMNSPAGCSIHCLFTGAPIFFAPDFTANLVAGSRFAVTGENGVWQVDEILDATHLYAHSLGNLTSAGASLAQWWKVGAALQFTTGALKGQEFPVTAESNSAGVQTVSINPFGNANLTGWAVGDTAYITPSLAYGDFIMWTDCVGDSSNNFTYSAAIDFPTPYSATMLRSKTCAPGSKYNIAKSVVGALYLQTVLATNIDHQPGFTSMGQFGHGTLGWAFIQSTVYGTTVDFRSVKTPNSVFAIDQSAAFDSLFYTTDLTTWNNAVISDNAFPPGDYLVFDTNAFFNAPSAERGRRPLTFGDNAQAGVYAAGRMNSYFEISADGLGSLSKPLAGLSGNPARPDRSPIMPYSQSGAVIGPGALVGAIH
ncbi:hypothetical protein [Rhodoblastus sp.]|uniref:hypothetical protein n=1 Tax=Rhodoblastus sp. TaxID=1962975 RepID=UPI003F986836